MNQLTRFAVGVIFFTFGCSALALAASGRYFAKLPPGAGLPEVWANILVLAVEIGIGLVGLKMLTSLLRQRWRRIDRGSRSTNALHTGTHRSACE